ncbi:FecR family protein [Mucilaginibacter glaciei]|uniref:FecR family protein n=1 Tax=Mucilaginibacter glaciei TaxID=2772109 RepID=A0A926S243_9SPHI|nr:FecR family protein [Mucilaginibacter glaciei]MBD1394735.1 FecR family protein [Mucilaginibacter glaciei]
MDTSRSRLSYLFNCYYSKTATLQERDELFALIAAGKKDDALSELIRTAWDDLHLTAPLFTTNQTDQILQNILTAAKPVGNIPNARPHPTFLLWTKLAAAAIVLFFLSFGAYLYLYQTKAPVKTLVAKNKVALHDALPGSSKALLTLANGNTIILDNAKNGTLAKQGNTLVNKTDDGKLVYNLSNIGDKDAAVSINTITTPRGGEYQIILPDGTKVWLNAASSLKFPTRFTGNSRDVEITGEAYFEVTKNKLMPFKVKTNRAEIEVLGTHFNVMAYDDESLMKTTLLEGAVNIKSGTSTYKLKPGEQAQVNATGNTNVTNNIDVDDEVAWKNGIFQFRDAGIDVILRQASRWYDIDITYKGKLTTKELNGRISRNVKASALLSMLNYSGANLHIEGKHIIVE